MTQERNDAGLPRRDGAAQPKNTPKLTQCSVEEIVATSWDRRLADEMIAELRTMSGEQARTKEMRRFLALKAYRGLLERLRTARFGKMSWEALRAVAHAMRAYALERPALSASAMRVPATDCCELNELHAQLAAHIADVLAECGIQDEAADTLLCVLRSLVRGFVLHEVMNAFLTTCPYDEVFDSAIDILVAGVSTLAAGRDGPAGHFREGENG